MLRTKGLQFWQYFVMVDMYGQPKTGIVPTVELNGTQSTNIATEVGNGIYKILVSATETELIGDENIIYLVATHSDCENTYDFIYFNPVNQNYNAGYSFDYSGLVAGSRYGMLTNGTTVDIGVRKLSGTGHITVDKYVDNDRIYMDDSTVVGGIESIYERRILRVTNDIWVMTINPEIRSYWGKYDYSIVFKDGTTEVVRLKVFKDTDNNVKLKYVSGTEYKEQNITVTSHIFVATMHFIFNLKTGRTNVLVGHPGDIFVVLDALQRCATEILQNNFNSFWDTGTESSIDGSIGITHKAIDRVQFIIDPPTTQGEGTGIELDGKYWRMGNPIVCIGDANASAIATAYNELNDITFALDCGQGAYITKDTALSDWVLQAYGNTLLGTYSGTYACDPPLYHRENALTSLLGLGVNNFVVSTLTNDVNTAGFKLGIISVSSTDNEGTIEITNDEIILTYGSTVTTLTRTDYTTIGTTITAINNVANFTATRTTQTIRNDELSSYIIATSSAEDTPYTVQIRDIRMMQEVRNTLSALSTLIKRSGGTLTVCGPAPFGSSVYTDYYRDTNALSDIDDIYTILDEFKTKGIFDYIDLLDLFGDSNQGFNTAYNIGVSLTSDIYSNTALQEILKYMVRKQLSTNNSNTNILTAYPALVQVDLTQENIMSVGSQTGDTAVDHNTGGTDALRYHDANDAGIDSATIRVYTAEDYDAGIYKLRAVTYTDSEGRWVNPIYLDDGIDYVIVVEKPGEFGPDITRITV